MDYQTMMMMAQAIQQEEQQEQQLERRVTIPCYGCAHMCASPVACAHPNSLSVRWDPVRKKPYRLPSLELCYTESGLCKFYEPHEERGAEYKVVQSKILKTKHQKKSAEIDDSISKLSNGDSTIDDFIEEITKLSEEMDDIVKKADDI